MIDFFSNMFFFFYPTPNEVCPPKEIAEAVSPMFLFSNTALCLCKEEKKFLYSWFFFLQVEQFWKFYSHMVRPGDLTGHSDFHLFKEGIKPMWEVRTFESRFVFFFLFFF